MAAEILVRILRVLLGILMVYSLMRIFIPVVRVLNVIRRKNMKIKNAEHDPDYYKAINWLNYIYQGTTHQWTGVARRWRRFKIAWPRIYPGKKIMSPLDALIPIVLCFGLFFAGFGIKMPGKIDIIVNQVTSFYIASRYTGGSNDGSADHPWTSWSNINWATISTGLSSEDVVINFDSRGDFSSGGSVSIGTSGSSSHLLSVKGDAKYCTGTSTVTWFDETSPGSGTTGNRALFGDTIYTGSNRAYVTIKGFKVDTPTYTGVGDNGGAGEVNTHITVDNIYVVGPTGASQPGINFSRLSTGSHDIVIRYCYISQSTAEGIYVGHSTEMDNYLTGVIVEYNTIVDCGTSGEGDIDIKPNVEAPIIRYNTHYDTSIAAASCGVACYADKAEIYGNKFYTLKTKGSEWGWGIVLTNYGSDGGTRKIITSCRIYNNLIYSNELDGIRIDATGASANMTGIKINSNVIASNARYGISTAVVSTITIAEMKNNIFYSNVNYDVQFVSGVTITSANNNCWYRPSGNSWYYQGAAHTWAEWQGHGFDSNGKNQDPLFTNQASHDYTLQGGSPCKDTGADLGSPYNVDINGVGRPIGSGWDMGAYES